MTVDDVELEISADYVEEDYGEIFVRVGDVEIGPLLSESVWKQIDEQVNIELVERYYNG
jgi:hypothetical protein